MRPEDGLYQLPVATRRRQPSVGFERAMADHPVGTARRHWSWSWTVTRRRACTAPVRGSERHEDLAPNPATVGDRRQPAQALRSPVGDRRPGNRERGTGEGAPGEEAR